MSNRYQNKKADIFLQGQFVGELEERVKARSYVFKYLNAYTGKPISYTMPVSQSVYEFSSFPPFFEGLLPEGRQLEALLRRRKIDADDLFQQLVVVGADLVGAVTVRERR